MRTTSFHRWLGLAAGLFVALTARGYVHRTDPSGVYVEKWYTSPVSMQVKLSATANLSDGNSQRSSAVAAMNAWNAQLGLVQFAPVLASPSTLTPNNGVNEIAITSTVDGQTFPTNALAVTLSYTIGDEYSEGDIAINSSYNWDSYRGPYRQRPDLLRTLLHELGHVIGLDHPDEHAQSVSAIMNSRASDLDQLSTDDIIGARALYGAPGDGASANDAFANATLLTTTDGATTRVPGSNIHATREAGEPRVANSSAVHSLWWKWTAPANGPVKLSTLGSNFDTVLGVYTGMAVDALTLVADNDDEETPAQNPNANRKRTSLVNFTAVAGTTYFIVVDGWGSESQHLATGYTGTIMLTLDFSAPIAPLITMQPVNVTVELGQGATFSVTATSRPSANYRWQRLPAAGGAWVDLIANPDYSGVSNTVLTVVTPTLAMDGDQFRCVITNTAGSATSNAATLRVTATPPSFSLHPSSATVDPGTSIEFRVSASGRPAPTLRWQRQPVGGVWTDLADGGAYTNTASDTLRVVAAVAMTGDQFRCVATNVAGSVASNPATLTVRAAPLPIITSQPVGGAFALDSALYLSVEATGATSYQWNKNGVPISGQTSNSLAIANLQATDAGTYQVVVSNAGGSINSVSVTVSLVALPVVTLQSSTRQLLAPGQVASFAISATGDGPLSYQWYYKGRRIEGATAASYTRTITGNADAGAYWAAVTDRQGTRHSSPFFVLIAHAQTNVVGWGDAFSPLLAVPADLSDAIALAVSSSQCFALRPDGSVRRWGSDSFGASFPAGLGNVVALASGQDGGLALKSDGTVVGAGNFRNLPPGLRDVVVLSLDAALKSDGTAVFWNPPYVRPGWSNLVAIAGTGYGTLGVKSDGTVIATGRYEVGDAITVPFGLGNVVSVACGANHSLALRADGTVLAWGSKVTGYDAPPAGLRDVVAIAAGRNPSLALKADGTIVSWGGSSFSFAPNGLGPAFAIAASDYTFFALRDSHAGQAPAVGAPNTTYASLGSSTSISTAAMGNPAPTLQWQRNGTDLPGQTGGALRFTNVQPADTGLYSAVARSGTATTNSLPAILGLIMSGKVAGSGVETGTNIAHANGNIYDQVLLQGTAASMTADFRQVTRLSFVDLSNDIVQVEFSGAGTLSLVLDNPTGPAPAENYLQPGVNYMKGHAGIVITGADRTTNLSVFSVGRATAVNQALFRSDITYDGVADLAFIAIQSNELAFGGLRAANASFTAIKGVTGVFAPSITFNGPVFIGDIHAADNATPMIILGWADDVRITGGDLQQLNARPVQVAGITQLKFTAGSTSHFVDLATTPTQLLAAKTNKGRFEQNGVDVTAQIVAPAP